MRSDPQGDLNGSFACGQIDGNGDGDGWGSGQGSDGGWVGRDGIGRPFLLEFGLMGGDQRLPFALRGGDGPGWEGTV